MASHRYPSIRVIQQPGAPPFFLTSVPAAELLEWCDVPRAKGDYMAGYQRVLDSKRTGDLANYLRLSPNNIVPGAVIVAVDSDYASVTDEGDGRWMLSVTEDARDFETKLQELWGSFTTRLTDDELSSASIEFSSSTNDADSDDDETFPTSYLASLAKELTAAVKDWEGVAEPRREAIRSYIDGVSKPGLIIDGQHRVFGAQGVSDHDVVLPVVVLPGLEFAEQVFQFYVLNSKARPLKPTELRRIVSTSLTNAEIDSLYGRFRAAGVEAEEARWTLLMNTHPDSPFQARVDFGYDEPGAIIPENVADQVVRGFMKMPQRRYRQLTQPLGELWIDPEQRLDIFFWFWSAVKETYAETWADAEVDADIGKKPQMFMKVALLTLQQFVLDRFVTALPYRGAGEPPPLSTEADVAQMVRSTLTNLPGTFFQKEWKMKQIDTSEGRKALYTAMETVWSNQGRIHGNMALFRG
jgi:hypothetical protein